MAGICDGRVVIVTGAGRGLGRAHALEFARQGARVVVNDVGAELDGTGASSGPAGEVVDQIRAHGRRGHRQRRRHLRCDGAKHLFDAAIEQWGDLDVVVNNAGILRDRMIFNMSVEDFDAVIRVHLRGTWSMRHHAAVYWRDKSKDGTTLDARIINTSSPRGLYTSMGQTNYGPAKAGIANMTVILAAELGRYGVTVNAISPGARTRMTDTIRARGPTPGGRLRLAAIPRTSRRWSSGWAARSPKTSPAASSTCAAATSASPSRGTPARARTRASAGTPRSSARSSPTCSPRRRPKVGPFGQAHGARGSPLMVWQSNIDVDSLVAIDVHVHAGISANAPARHARPDA